MRENNPTNFTVPASAAAETVASTNPWKKRAVIGFLASLFIQGLGQVYLRRPWRGLIMAVTLSIMELFVSKSRIFLTFSGLISGTCLIVTCHLYVAVEPIFLARGNRNFGPNQAPSKDWLLFAGLLVFLVSVYPLPHYMRRQMTYFGANRIASASMCPTFCEGDRIVVDKDAYKQTAPQRGDIVVFQFKEEKAPFVKRVIGVGGDTVAPGLGNAILVNGTAIPKPKVCKKPEVERNSDAQAVDFCPIKVSQGSLFLIGDNLNNSFDSRFPDFGLISVDKLRGKALYLYWSRDRSRIGCKLQ